MSDDAHKAFRAHASHADLLVVHSIAWLGPGFVTPRAFTETPKPLPDENPCIINESLKISPREESFMPHFQRQHANNQIMVLSGSASLHALSKIHITLPTGEGDPSGAVTSPSA